MRRVFCSTVAACALAFGTLAFAANEVVNTADAPEAIGPYSQAIKNGNMMFLSGMLPIDPKTKKLMNEAGIEDQTKLVFDNLKAVLAANGMTLANVTMSTVFMKDLNDFAKMNAVYATYFTSSPPARQTVEVARLPRDVKIEISLIAVK
jgi:2-iminobutanoate/2-iminopropanoate deaminase